MILDEESSTNFCYFVKLIPQKQSDAKTFEWHDVQERFDLLHTL